MGRHSSSPAGRAVLVFVVARARTAAFIQGGLLMLLLWAMPSLAAAAEFVPLDDLDARRTWRITSVDVEGLDVLQRFLYVPKLQTQTRPWWSSARAFI